MDLTDYHAKYYAFQLTRRCSSDDIEKLAGALVDARVDLNPLYDVAAKFEHCICTTHYKPWREKYRWGLLRKGECQFVELLPWGHATGITLGTPRRTDDRYAATVKGR
jgi:hypothetical protein